MVKRTPVMPSVDSHNDLTGHVVPQFMYQIAHHPAQVATVRALLARRGAADVAEMLGIQ